MSTSSTQAVAYAVVFYEWQGWKSFRSLSLVSFKSKAEAEAFCDQHPLKDDDTWYFEVFPIEPQESAAKALSDSKEED